jgi:hypothetical protein
MRCPKCARQQGARRHGMRCQHCGYHHVLDPHKIPYVTDRRVIFAARRASDHGRRWYTTRQLFGELVRKRPLRRWWRRAAKQAEMDAVVDAAKLLRLNGWTFQGLIAEPMLDGSAPPEYPEPDLFDYGAERILVVDDAILVDLLVRNGVHTDARAIIVAATGYPSQVVERAASLIQHRPAVPIHLLHASGLDVAAMVSTTRALLAAPDATPKDVGLSSQAARKIGAIRWARRLASVPVDVLPHRWLTRGLVEALTTGTSLDALTERDDGGGSGDFG